MSFEFHTPAVERFMEIVRAWALHPWPMTRAQGIATYKALGWMRADDDIESFTTDCTGDEAESFFYVEKGKVESVSIAVSPIVPPAPQERVQQCHPPVLRPLRRGPARAVGRAAARVSQRKRHEALRLDRARRRPRLPDLEQSHHPPWRVLTRVRRRTTRRTAHKQIDLRRPGRAALSTNTTTRAPE